MTLEDIALALGRVEGKLDIHLESAAETRQEVEGLSVRVSKVEHRHGVLTALAAVFAAGITQLGNHLWPK